MTDMKPLTRKKERPYMPGYGLGEDEGSLSWDWVSEQATRSRSYWVCSTRPNGRPHAMPVWGVWVQDTLVFSTSRSSRKGRNLAANPSVAVHLESGDEAVIIEGYVEEILASPLFEAADAAYQAKYGLPVDGGGDAEAVVTYAVRPRVVFAWLENDFANSAVRWKFKEVNEK